MSVLHASRFITFVLCIVVISSTSIGQDVQITWCYFNFQFRKNNIRSHDLVREFCDHAIRNAGTHNIIICTCLYNNIIMTTHVRRVRPCRDTPLLELFLKILSMESLQQHYAVDYHESRCRGSCNFKNHGLSRETQILDISVHRLLLQRSVCMYVLNTPSYSTCLHY